MKILLVASILRENDAISDHVIWQANLLKKENYEVSILCMHADHNSKRNILTGVELTATVDPILALLRINQAELVIIHFGIYSKLFEVFEIVPISKIVFWDHNVTPAALVKMDSQWLISLSMAQRKTLSRSKKIVVDSYFTSLDWPGRNPLVSPPPLRDAFVNIFQSKKLSVKKKKNNVITVGRFTHSKGSEELLKVLTNPALNFMNFQVVVPIEGNDEFLLKKLMQLKRKNVKVFVNIETIELAELYASSRFALSLSKHEGLGLGQIEAFAAGCIPIVWPEAGATHYLVPSELGLHLASPTCDDVQELFLKVVNPFLQKETDNVLTSRGEILFENWNKDRKDVVSNYLPTNQSKLLLELVKERFL
jgi:glycosyltransferase involved in cell wall biosynthesis